MTPLSRSSRPPRLQRPAFRSLLLTAAFVWLLSAIYFLGHNTTPPASRWIGWQKDDPIYGPPAKGKAKVQDLVGGNGNPDGSHSVPVGGAYDDYFGPSIPMDQYAPVVSNPTPLTDIEVKNCLPLIECKPASNPDIDAKLGPWVRVERPLDPNPSLGSLGSGGLSSFMNAFEQKYIFYRRSRRSDVRRVTDIQLVEEGSERPDGNLGWHRCKTDLRTKLMTKLWGKEKPLHLYFKTVGGEEDDTNGGKVSYDHLGRPIFAQGAGFGEKDALTELDVMYGTAPPFPGFTSAGQISASEKSLNFNAVTLLIRRKPLPPPTLEKLQFNLDGKFKILQLADLHFSVGHEECRDVSNPKYCIADDDTIKMIERWLDHEKPDFVVLSGDQLNGQKTSWDVRSVVSKAFSVVINRKIPWAAILGNHDSQAGSMTRRQQANLLSTLPYSYTLAGPPDLHNGNGAGNYYVNLYAPNTSSLNSEKLQHLFSLYFLDSGDILPPNKWKPWDTETHYDYLRPDQIQWFLGHSESIKPIYRPFTLDGAKDLDRIWTERKARRSRRAGDGTWDGNADQNKRVEKPPAMLWVHIPVEEAFAPVDKDENGKELIVGERKEKATFQGAQDQGGQPGLFDALKAQGAAKDVKVLLHGHMHNNADCRRISGIWICFDGGSSFAGYGLQGFQRRSRVLEISKFGEKITSWQVMEKDVGRYDEVVLYDGKG